MSDRKYRPEAALTPTPEELARWIGGTLADEEHAPATVTGLATLDEAEPTELAFVADKARFEAARASGAGLLLTPEGSGLNGRARIEVGEVWSAVSEVMRRLYPLPVPEPGVHKSAVIDKGVELGEDVSVGPLCYVGEGARLDDRVVLGPHCSIAPGCTVGEGSRFHARVTLQCIAHVGRRAILHSGVVLGADGFKFEQGMGGITKIPQVGAVVLEDDVELGANTTIDRAFLHETRIGQGTKLDNLIHVGHNSNIGKFCLIAAGCDIAGSVTIEDGCLLGGAISVREGMTIGKGSMIAGASGIAKSLEPGSVVMGYPAFRIEDFMRSHAHFQRLPKLARRVAALEKSADKSGT